MCKRCVLGETLTRAQASVGISQPCERPLVTSHVPSGSLFFSLLFSPLPLLLTHPPFLLSFFPVACFRTCFLVIIKSFGTPLHWSCTTSKQKSDSCFSLFVLLSVRKLQHRRVYYRREVSSDGIQTIGEDKHDVMQRTTWTDNNKSSR